MPDHSRASGVPAPVPVVRHTDRTTAAGAATAIAERLTHGDPENALRVVWQLAGDLLAVDADRLPALTVTAPVLCGDPRFDALIAAVVDHILHEAGVLPVPVWVAEPTRTVDPPWDVEPVEVLREAARAVTPAAIRRHGVFLDPSELVNL